MDIKKVSRVMDSLDSKKESQVTTTVQHISPVTGKTMEQNLEKVIADFESETGYKLQIKGGWPYYRGNLDLHGTSITSLPDGLVVDGNLDLEDCTGITSLPNDLAVGGLLDLSGTGITSLPNDLVVGGNLDLYNTSITFLPNDLTVGGNLYLRGTSITSLPNDLAVGGYLDLHGTGITSLPKGLTEGYSNPRQH